MHTTESLLRKLISLIVGVTIITLIAVNINDHPHGFTRHFRHFSSFTIFVVAGVAVFAVVLFRILPDHIGTRLALVAFGMLILWAIQQGIHLHSVTAVLWILVPIVLALLWAVLVLVDDLVDFFAELTRGIPLFR